MTMHLPMLSNGLRIGAAAASLLLCGAPAHAQGESARPPLLAALDGTWVMSGDVRGKPVTYALQAGPALMGAFTELRMQDVSVPSKYAAHVYIGHDGGKVIVHWMDSFGAKYSIPHALGAIDGNTLQFTFPYSSGKFRDTFTWHPDGGYWTFALESEAADGSWKHFAKYKVVKAGAPAGAPR